ncbi:hypothetical protein ScPMuIL_005032 [Solemya velum]
MLQVQGQGFGYPNQHRQELKMKDHFRENVKRMRQIQRKCKERDADGPHDQPLKALWQSEKYRNVQSRIKTDLEMEPPTPRPRSASFLRAHSRAGPIVTSARRAVTPDPPPEKLTVPRAASANSVKMNRNTLNFIKVNGLLAKSTKIQQSPSLTELDNLKIKDEENLMSYQRGVVPKYLRQRQEGWKKAEEERIANTPDPSLPPGHRVLPEPERKQTLSLLLSNQSELLAQLNSMPLRMDTFRVRTRRQELDQKLSEVEEGIKIFSRPKVFVKIDK